MAYTWKNELQQLRDSGGGIDPSLDYSQFIMDALAEDASQEDLNMFIDAREKKRKQGEEQGIIYTAQDGGAVTEISKDNTKADVVKLQERNAATPADEFRVTATAAGMKGTDFTNQVMEAQQKRAAATTSTQDKPPENTSPADNNNNNNNPSSGGSSSGGSSSNKNNTITSIPGNYVTTPSGVGVRLPDGRIVTQGGGIYNDKSLIDYDPGFTGSSNTQSTPNGTNNFAATVTTMLQQGFTPEMIANMTTPPTNNQNATYKPYGTNGQPSPTAKLTMGQLIAMNIANGMTLDAARAAARKQYGQQVYANHPTIVNNKNN